MREWIDNKENGWEIDVRRQDKEERGYEGKHCKGKGEERGIHEERGREAFRRSNLIRKDKLQ